MNMRLACADFTFPLLDHDGALDLIALMKLKGVDVGLFEGRSHLWPSREFGNVDKSARALRRKVGDRGLKVADVFLQMNADFVPYAINHPEPRRRRKARDWFQRTLAYAAECEARHVTTLPGVFFPDEARSAGWGRSVDELAWRVEQAKQHRIIFAVEAHLGSVTPKPKPAKALVEAVPGLTLTLDYTHFTRAGFSDKAVEPLVQHASHFHARGARRGRLQTSFDDNTIDYRRIVNTMKRTGYRGWIGVEYVWIDWEHCNEVDNLSETIRFRDFFNSLKG
jgi:sugar phosphate isomerase/epimerase